MAKIETGVATGGISNMPGGGPRALGPLPLERISISLREASPREGSDHLTELLTTLIERFKSNYLSNYPNIQAFLERHLPSEGRSTRLISDVLLTLNTIRDHLKPNLKIQEEPEDETMLQRPQRFHEGLLEYFKVHGGAQKCLSELTQCSCHDPVHDKATKWFKDRNYIGNDDVMVISGSGGASSSGGVQICVIDSKSANRLSRDQAWFLANINVGESEYRGYFAPGNNLRSFSIQGRVEVGEYDAFSTAIDDFSVEVTKSLHAQGQADPLFYAKLAAGVPLIPITQKFANQVPFVFFSPKTNYYPTGNLNVGDVIAGHAPIDSGTPSISALINHYQIVSTGYAPGAGGFNSDLATLFTYPGKFEGIATTRAALESLRSNGEEIADTYATRFTAKVDSFRNPRVRSHVFPWLFEAWDYPGGYTPYVQYNYTQIVSALEWVANTARKLGPTNPAFQEIFEPIERYLAGEAGRKLRECTAAQDIGGKRNKYGTSRGGKRIAFDDDMLKLGSDSDFDDGMILDVGPNHDYIRTSESHDKGTVASAVLKITRQFPKETYQLRKALRKFEYLLIWNRFAVNSEVPTTFATVAISHPRFLIEDGRNLPLVLDRLCEDGSKLPVVPNSLLLSDAMSAIMLIGANGGGKTHLLEMIAHNIAKSHRGLPVVAANMETPVIGRLSYSVNASVHSQRQSAFQGEVRQLCYELSQIDRSIPGSNGMAILDEAFRGTDKRDAVPLLVGLLWYLKQRGIYFVGSTHFNSFGILQEAFEEYGIKVGNFTMIPDQFKMTEGSGKSRGIQVAEERGLEPEIIECARSVAMNGTIPASTIPALEQVLTTTHVAPETAEELGIAKRSDDHQWGPHRQIGSAFRVFANGAVWTSTEYVSEGDRTSVPVLRPDAAEAFFEVLERPLDTDARTLRVNTIDRLIDKGVAESLVPALEKLGSCYTHFSMRVKRGHIAEELIKRLDIDIGLAKELQDRRIEFDRFILEIKKTNIPALFSAIEQVATQIESIGESEIEPLKDEIQRFLNSPLKRDLDQLTKKYEFLRKGSGAFEMENWEEWVNLCIDNKNQLIDLHRTLLQTHAFVTVARTMTQVSWPKTFQTEDRKGTIELETALNTRLAADMPALKITAIDFNSPGNGVASAVTGTNGGGKSQGLQAIGVVTWCAQQLGRAPAEKVSYGAVPFFAVMLSSSEHSNKASSFQDEISRIQKIVNAYKAAGEPRGGLVILDEPFKGTSEEEAIPLLVGLINYFQSRNIKVVFTTHFSGLFDTLEKLNKPLPVQPWHVDYFSPSERYALRPGIGKSSGIRVAEQLGLPQEIIRIADEVVERWGAML